MPAPPSASGTGVRWYRSRPASPWRPVGLNALLLFLIPLAVAIFAGESVAGEAGWGSLRYLLARPVSRRRVLTSKAVVAGLFSLVAVAVVVAAGVLSGLVAFGWHPLPVLDLQHNTPFSTGLSTMTPVDGPGPTGLPRW